jgi:microsomal dipeptidase-like Zn-dependent dipeptidase
VIDELYAAGFRMMSPAHFTDGAVAAPLPEPTKAGLLPWVAKWVKHMEARGMLIDVSHASAATLHDVTYRWRGGR